MKKILFLLLIASTAQSQDWIRMMNDPDVNFYTVKDAFDADYRKQLKKEKNPIRKIFRWTKEAEQESPGIEVYRRWEFFNANRVYPSGNRIQPDHLWKEYGKFTTGYPHSSFLTSGNWTSLGPSSWLTNSYNPGIGRVNAVGVDPADPMKLYIGAPAGGLWKSTDGGATWQQPTTDHLPSIGVSAIAIDPGNTDIIYIGTGDADAGDSYSNGVLKSVDGGLTWQPSGLSWSLTQSRKISRLLIDPSNGQILFAATNNGIYKTTDGAATWTLVRSGSFRDMEFKPGNSSVIYAAGNSFYRSDDGGNTFNALNAGLPPSTSVDRLSIAVTAADSNYVYLAAGESGSSGFLGLYKSTDGGSNFTIQSNSPNVFGWSISGNDGGGQSWYSMTLCASPVNAEEIFTGGVNIWHSADGGITWDIKTHWYLGGPLPYVHADQHFMEFTGNTIYVGCDGGFFISNDSGINWEDKSFGMSISQFYRIGGTETEPGMLMAGAQDNGCNLLRNGQWTHVLGADGMEVAINPQNTQNIFAESQNGGISRSTNGGLTMSNITAGINESGDWVTPFVLDPLTPAIMYAGFENVWQSMTNGLTWSKISNFTNATKITAITVSEANSAYIYIVRGNTLYMTDDGGFNWYNRSNGLPVALAAPTSIAVHPQDALKAWVTFSGTSAGNKVYMTNDGGLTWSNVSINLPNIPVNCIVYQNGTANGLYIATDLGVFYKNDSLSGWQPFWNGLPNVVVNELEINYAAGKIRAATFGRGAWESDLFVLSGPPQALFTANRQDICPNESVQFTDLSLEAFSSWQWSFPGGTPSSSNVQFPVISYAAPGSYDVQLVVSNSSGTDTLVKSLYINVAYPPTGSVPLAEGFESGIFPPAGWKVMDNDGMITWEENNTGAFGSSLHSVYVPNFNNSLNGAKDWLLTPVIDVTQLSDPWLRFDRAYARIPNRADSLNIFYTTDCGSTRNYIYGKTGFALATAGVLTTSFLPSSGQWAMDSLPLNMITGPVQIGFENRNGFGNNLYIDNINIYNGAVSVAEHAGFDQLSVWPNPADDVLNIESVVTAGNSLVLKVMDSTGRIVYSTKAGNSGTVMLQTAAWENGLYIIELSSADGKMSWHGKARVMHK